jgi:pimeloyl-ACP methyl ester carboxylesterase
MPRLTVDDGVELHYSERGSGPLVVLVSYWSFHPSVFGPISDELAGDHRVLSYDDRGTGLSTRRGPYDLDTATADLVAVIEATGEPATLICSADGANRGVRAATARPELVEGVIAVGGAPLGRDKFTGIDVLASSEGVVEALLAQVETDYKGTLRGILAATNTQMDEAELRARIDAQVEHVPQEAAAARLRIWAHDEPLELALATSDRLWVLVSEIQTGGWFPAGRQLAEVVARELPDARLVAVSDGMVSRPDETAAVVREITAAIRAGPVET